MRRIITLFCISTALLACGRSASAGWNEFWHQFHLDYKRNQVWPDPFRHGDRDATRAPFIVMTNNGWRLNNTLGHDLFDAEKNELNHAGWRKVRWIVTEAPVHRRSIYVLYGPNPAATQARLESVRQSVIGIVGEEMMPPIMLTNRAPRGVAGDYVDQVDRSYRSSIPAPVLPARMSETGQ
jgi:hypothetical protein